MDKPENILFKYDYDFINSKRLGAINLDIRVGIRQLKIIVFNT